MDLPRLTLVLGGARSGKSRHAEALVQRAKPPWIYLATAQALDDEMLARIEEHRARRGDGWQTVEALIALPDALRGCDPSAPVLVDCVTLWLSNVMLGELPVEPAIEELDLALEMRKGPTVLVANEVGLGIVPDSRLGRDFRDAAGRLNQRLAERADHVLMMVAGLPLTVKPES